MVPSQISGAKAIFALAVLASSLLCTSARAEVQSVTFASLPTITASGNYSGTGTLNVDDDVQLFSFSLDYYSKINLFTTSWADPSVNGFETVLSLYKANADPSQQTLLAVGLGGIAPGGCGARSVDPVLGLCLDAYIATELAAGDYILALTQNTNVPTAYSQYGFVPDGASYADGFTRTGDPYFTATDCGTPYAFAAEGAGSCLPRSNQWELTIDATPTPEPSPAVLVTFGLAVLGLARRRFGMAAAGRK